MANSTMLETYLHGAGIATPNELAECIQWLTEAGAPLPTEVDVWELTICNWRMVRGLEAARRDAA